MISEKDVKKLGQLARIGIKKEEVKSIQEDLEKILGFVSKLKELSIPEGDNLGVRKTPTNNIREDDSDSKGGEYMEKLLEQAPDVEEEFVKVKKVL